MKFEIPKDKVDEALNAEIKRLTRENRTLKNKVAKLEAQVGSNQAIAKQVSDIRKRFQELIDEYADHTDCDGG